MLVLIRDWLLAGVSSPWLPSLGGDCSGQEGFSGGCVSAARSFTPRAAHLDVDLVAQHSCPQNHGLGTSLELLAHQQGLLKGGAALIHISSIQYLYKYGRFRMAQQATPPTIPALTTHLAV